ncbi:MAG: hypothetical protein P0111_06845 [Nitrospira sp.]|nr:hypothetical protein [Nitrospira sp.]
MMSNLEKAEVIRRWVNPEERITVQFDDARDLNAEVTDCTDQLVVLALDTDVPHMRQQLSIPLSKVEVGADPSHYTRDPDQPLRLERLLLLVKGNRPPVVY